MTATTEVVQRWRNALLQPHQIRYGLHVLNICNTTALAASGTTGLSGDWINEIHPAAYGYSLLGRKIALALANLSIMCNREVIKNASAFDFFDCELARISKVLESLNLALFIHFSRRKNGCDFIG